MALANYSLFQSRARRATRACRRSGEADRGLLCHQPALNSEAVWFWTFQSTYYAIAKSKLKGLPKLYSGVIDVSDTWLE